MRLSKYVKILFRGQSFAKKIIKNNNNDVIAFCLKGVGDLTITLAFLGHYKRIYGKTIAFLSSQPDSPLFKMWPNSFDTIIPCSTSDLEILRLFLQSDAGYVFLSRNHELLPIIPFVWCRPLLYNKNNYSNYLIIHKWILNLPENTKPEDPCDISDGLRAKHILENVQKKSCMVLINPLANSINSVPMSFFKKIAIELSKRGLVVFSNVEQDNFELSEGIKNIRFSLSDCLSICSCFDYVIGLRSGFLDLAQFANTNCIAIDSDEYLHCSFYKLENIWDKGNRLLITKTYTKSNEQQLISEINELIKGERYEG